MHLAASYLKILWLGQWMAYQGQGFIIILLWVRCVALTSIEFKVSLHACGYLENNYTDWFEGEN